MVMELVRGRQLSTLSAEEAPAERALSMMIEVLRALEHGVYDHVPGDGRERVVSLADAVKIRAEDGRRIEGVVIGVRRQLVSDGTRRRRLSGAAH